MLTDSPLSAKLAEDLGSGLCEVVDTLIEDIVLMRGDGWKPEDTNFYDRLPIIARPLYRLRMAMDLLFAADAMAIKIFGPTKSQLGCTAEELLFYWTVEGARAVSAPMKDDVNDELEDYFDSALEDTDFIFLFDPKYDGIDKIKELHIQSLDPKDWFIPFNPDRETSPLAWPDKANFLHSKFFRKKSKGEAEK